MLKITIIQSLNNQIESTNKRKGRGKIIFTKYFSLIGTAFTVRQIFSRLCKNGMLLRLASGTYLYPKTSKLLGIVYPSVEEVMKQIAKRESLELYLPNPML
ncbi:MAG: DUF6088 family protein [Tannerella sp.]|jgi:hypothetical protein|nr:DUF6088 family protein [Tannerella sp.]